MALSLALTFPGAGQFYNHQAHKGLSVCAGFWSLLFLSVYAFGTLNFFVSMTLLCSLIIFGAGDAYSTARALEGRPMDGRRKANFLTWIGIILTVLIFMGVNFAAVFYPTYVLQWDAPNVGFQRGDGLLVDAHYYRNHTPRIGDMIMVRAGGDFGKIIQVDGVRCKAFIYLNMSREGHREISYREQWFERPSELGKIICIYTPINHRKWM